MRTKTEEVSIEEKVQGGESFLRDLGLLALRLTAGGLMAGHGAQKLFGLFGGYGLEGTAGWMESMGLKPGKPWAMMAGWSEFGSGVLMSLGLFHPLGPISLFGPMLTAWEKVHRGKPIWVTSGGAELPLLNIAVAVALTLSGPGRLSLDRLLGIKTPRLLSLLTLLGVVAGVGASMAAVPPPPAEANKAGGELQAGRDAEGAGADTVLGD